jgi:hypothetical protein
MGQEDQSRKGRLILMPHSHVSCLVHLVFSTSGQQPTIRDRHHRVLARDLGHVSMHHERVSRGIQKISDGTRDAAMIQPSQRGLVHALFATQHCVLGYYQAVPAGLSLEMEFSHTF